MSFVYVLSGFRNWKGATNIFVYLHYALIMRTVQVACKIQQL